MIFFQKSVHVCQCISNCPSASARRISWCMVRNIQYVLCWQSNNRNIIVAYEVILQCVLIWLGIKSNIIRQYCQQCTLIYYRSPSTRNNYRFQKTWFYSDFTGRGCRYNLLLGWTLVPLNVALFQEVISKMFFTLTYCDMCPIVSYGLWFISIRGHSTGRRGEERRGEDARDYMKAPFLCTVTLCGCVHASAAVRASILYRKWLLRQRSLVSCEALRLSATLSLSSVITGPRGGGDLSVLLFFSPSPPVQWGRRERWQYKNVYLWFERDRTYLQQGTMLMLLSDPLACKLGRFVHETPSVCLFLFSLLSQQQSFLVHPLCQHFSYFPPPSAHLQWTYCSLHMHILHVCQLLVRSMLSSWTHLLNV